MTEGTFGEVQVRPAVL